jgi:hypothetical protein
MVNWHEKVPVIAFRECHEENHEQTGYERGKDNATENVSTATLFGFHTVECLIVREARVAFGVFLVTAETAAAGHPGSGGFRTVCLKY